MCYRCAKGKCILIPESAIFERFKQRAHPAAEKKVGGESRLVADFSTTGWRRAELTPITRHNLLQSSNASGTCTALQRHFSPE